MIPIHLVGWLPITILAYSFHALAVILDKFLLARKIQKPSTYTFWVGVLGLGAFALAPIDFFVPGAAIISNAFVSGIAFTLALFFFYTAIQRGEASRVASVIGGLSPIFVFLLSRGILGETLNRWELTAFVVLIAGSVLISLTRKRGGRFNEYDLRSFGLVLLASFLFGVTYVYAKAVFNDTSFINGFIWTRLGGFVGALPFLFFSATRESIFETPRAVDRTTVWVFLMNKVFGALGFFLVSFAISIAPSVSLVNAMQGIEYALIFVFALVVSRIRPAFLSEEVTPLIIFEKTFAILLIVAGLALLSFSQ